MLYETGLVVELIADRAVIQTQSKSTCSACRSKDTCGNGMIDQYLSGRTFSIEVENLLDANIGQQVVIQVPKSSITRAAFFTYFIPLLTFISFAMVISQLSDNETWQIFISLIGLFLGFMVTKFYNLKIARHEFYTPRMVKLIGREATDENSIHSKPQSSEAPIKFKQL